MLRFFFHLRNGERILDEEGLLLPDLETAREGAISGARSIISDEAMRGRLPLRDIIEVADERGETLLTINFRDVVQIDL